MLKKRKVALGFFVLHLFVQHWSPTFFLNIPQATGNETIEGIIPHNRNYQNVLEEVSFTTTTFKRMSELRILSSKCESYRKF